MKRCYSLKRNKRFRQVYRRGRSESTRQLVMVYHRSGSDPLQVGFAVSKKLGNSVVRNRVKRRLREAFRPMIPRVKAGYDIIFIARDAAVNAEFSALIKAMDDMLSRAGLFKRIRP